MLSHIISNKISSGKKNYKYFIGYIDDDYKIKPFSIVLSKMSAYKKRYDGETKWKYFLIEVDVLLKNMVIFGIKSAMVLKTNLIANPSAIKDF